MQLKLLLKQSFRDFVNKIPLYLTFTFFLILAISVSLGMISFSHGFKNSFDQTLGNHRMNAILNANTFLPASIEETEPTKIKNYEMKEEKNEQGVGYLEDFLTNEDNGLMPELKELNKEDYQRFFLGIGYKAGETWGLSSSEVIRDELLSDPNYFGNDESTEEKLKIFNENALKLRAKLNLKYQTINLETAFFLEKLKNNPDWTLSGFRGWRSPGVEIVNNGTKPLSLFWEYLKTDSSMGKIDETTPWTLKVNQTNTQKIWKQVNLQDPKYQDFLNDQRIVYVQPNFLPKYNYHLGDVVQLKFTHWNNKEHQAEPEPFLIAGTITFPDNLIVGKKPTFSFPFKKVFDIYKKWDEANGDPNTVANFPSVFGTRIYFNVGSKNGDVEGAQQTVDFFLNQIFSNLKNPEEKLISNSSWTKWNPAYAYEFSQIMFLIIAYAIGIVILGLLFVVFYFITQQIVVLQRKTLFFLKAMGVKNSGLSLLTTFSMFFPMVVGTIASIFGSLLIQQTMYGIGYEKTAFYEPYFSFNWVYFITLLSFIILTSLIFYLINMVLMKSKSLTLEGMAGLKTNAKLFEKVKVRFNKTPAKLRIGLSFAFKNMYKNLISYFILSITFGIILFATQFNSSLEVSARAYEKWNLPYKSVNYADNLNVFAPTKEGDTWQSDEYVREYEKTFSLDNLTKISSDDDLRQTILTYHESLDNPEIEFNWKNYYLGREYVKEKLDLIADNPDAYAEFIAWLTKFIEETWLPDPVDKEVILGIVNLIDQVVQKYRDVRDQYDYHEGFAILMGRVFAPPKNRAVLSLQTRYVLKNAPVRTIAFEQDDWDSKKHFGFEKIKNDDNFLIQGSYKEYDPINQKIVIKEGTILRINVSSYFQSIYNIRRGDVFELEVNGLKSFKNLKSSKVMVYVDGFVKDDTFNSTVYTSQTALIKYVIKHLEEEETTVGPLIIDEAREKQKKVYEDLLAELVQGTESLSNTVFDQEYLIPLGVRYITMPIFHHTVANKDIGTRIEDFYDAIEFPEYLKDFGQNAMIFSEATKQLLAKAEPFNETLQKFVYILLAISLAVSSILITLVLLENREVILLFKAMGYKKSEVNWYLISGYFISAILATITAAGIALLILRFARGPIAEFLTTSVNFVWSWQFITFAFGLAAVFCLAISLSIVVYTNIQKPRNAFVAL